MKADGIFDYSNIQIIITMRESLVRIGVDDDDNEAVPDTAG